MIRTLLATTALTGLMTVGAYAQSTTDTTQTTTHDPATAITLQDGFTATGNDHLATKLIGMAVYESDAYDADQVGDINDLILDGNGDVVGAVIGVGGFLGIGEKQVAIGYDQLKWETVEQPDPMDAATGSDADSMASTDTGTTTSVAPEEGTATDMAATDNANAAQPEPEQRLIFSATREDLENAPEFKWNEDAQTAAVNPSDTDGTLNQSQDDMQTSSIDNVDQTANPTSPDGADMTQLQAATLSADDLIGSQVIGPNDEQVGDVGDILLNSDGDADTVIVDVGGFLGIGEKPVAIAIDNLRFTADQSGKHYIWVNLTKDQLESQPAYDPSTYAQNKDDMRLTTEPYSS